VSSGGDELGRFVGKALARGVSRAAIGQALAQADWTAEQGRAALAAWADVRLLFAAASDAMVGAVAAGLSVIGSPAIERAVKIDQRRIDDLPKLEPGAVGHWNEHQSLPERLERSDLLREPVTDAPYEYRVVEGDRLRLCAVFGTASPPRDGPPKRATPDAPAAAWAHPAGRHCYRFSAARGKRLPND
jgi:hypothetical protein